MGADAVEDEGLTLAQLKPETELAVSKSLPGFASARNPIDITAALLSNSGLFGDVLPFVAKDPAVDMFFIHIPVSGAGYDVERFANDFTKVEKETGKPVVLASWQENVASVFRSKGVATFDNEAQAIGVLGQIAHHSALLREPRAQWDTIEPCVLPPGIGPYLHESDTLNLLASRGIKTVKHVLCQTSEQAGQAVAQMGVPVAVKACSMDVPHKSEHGLVALNIQSSDAAAKAFDQQSDKLKSMGARQDGIIVAAMEKGNLEMMIGAHRDPQFGLVVLVGAGGKYVEALKDCALLLAPFGKEDVIRALNTLRIAPLLNGVRGEPAADMDAFADMAVRVGKMMVALGETASSIDLNPVMMTPSGPVVVDALLERRAGHPPH
jgi:acyl-CoA synthetase (NDP forming)